MEEVYSNFRACLIQSNYIQNYITIKAFKIFLTANQKVSVNCDKT